MDGPGCTALNRHSPPAELERRLRFQKASTGRLLRQVHKISHEVSSGRRRVWLFLPALSDSVDPILEFVDATFQLVRLGKWTAISDRAIVPSYPTRTFGHASLDRL